MPSPFSAPGGRAKRFGPLTQGQNLDAGRIDSVRADKMRGSPPGLCRAGREGIGKKQENFAEEIAKQLGK